MRRRVDRTMSNLRSGGYFPRLSPFSLVDGLTGLRSNPPPQFGQTLPSYFPRTLHRTCIQRADARLRRFWRKRDVAVFAGGRASMYLRCSRRNALNEGAARHVVERLLVDREDRHLRRAEQRRIVERSDLDQRGAG